MACCCDSLVEAVHELCVGPVGVVSSVEDGVEVQELPCSIEPSNEHLVVGGFAGLQHKS